MNSLMINDLFFIPICFSDTTILLGHIVRMEEYREGVTVITLTDGTKIHTKSSLTSSTKLMYESIVKGRGILQ